MNKYIDFIEGIPKDKFLITDTGRIFNMYSKRELHPTIDRVNRVININHYENGKRTMKIICVDDLVLQLFGDTHGFDVNNPFLWVFHRDLDHDNCDIKNLILCLRDTNIPVTDVPKIYDMLKDSIWDNIEISKRLGYFIPKRVVVRLTRSQSAKRIASVFGYFHKDIMANYPYKTSGPPVKITIDEAKTVCQKIVDFGPDVDYIFEILSPDMPALTRAHIFQICHKKMFVKISDEFFKDPVELERGESDPPRPSWPDLPGEIWKKIDDIDLNINYYVSNKGRVRNPYGRILQSHVVRGTTVMVQLACSKYSSRSKAFSVARLVMLAFGISLPDVLGLDTSLFEVECKNGDRSDLGIENLVWRPKGSRDFNNGYSLHDINEIINIMNNSKDVDETKDRIKYEVLHNSSINQIHCISVGRTYEYLTKDLSSKNWKPIKIRGVPDGVYFVSDDGLVRKHQKLLRIFQRPLEEVNFVTICGKDYRVDRLVLNAFIGTKPKNDHNFIYHIDNNMLNDSASNLSWVRHTPETQRTTIGKYHSLYGEPERWTKLVWPNIAEEYSISSCGRVRLDTKNKILALRYTKNKYGRPYVTVNLRTKSGKFTAVTLRNLVYETFCGHIEEGWTAIEIDGNPMNCHYKNLSKDLYQGHGNSKRHVYTGKKIAKYNNNGKLIKIFDTADDAANDSDTNANNIRQRIVKNIVVDGYYWTYYNDENK